MTPKNIGNYAKSLISLLTSAESVLSLYPHIHWAQAVASGVGTFLVWLVPNVPSITKTAETITTDISAETPKGA